MQQYVMQCWIVPCEYSSALAESDAWQAWKESDAIADETV
jgi:hypothetical protein